MKIELDEQEVSEVIEAIHHRIVYYELQARYAITPEKKKSAQAWVERYKMKMEKIASKMQDSLSKNQSPVAGKTEEDLLKELQDYYNQYVESAELKALRALAKAVEQEETTFYKERF